MAINTIKTTDLATTLRTEWDAREFIEVLREKLVFARLGRRDDIPRNSGKTVRWNLFNQPTADVTTNGTEGADPTNSTDPTSTAVTAALAEYKGVTQFSKFLDISSISGTRQEIVKQLAHKAALSIDTLCQTQSMQDAGNINDVGAFMTADALKDAVAELVALDVEPHPMSPNGQFYIFVCSAGAAYDMMGEGSPAWFQVKSDELRAALQSPFEGTPVSAAIYGAIVKISTNIQTAGGNDLNYLIGKDAFGVSSLESDVLSPEIIITEPAQLVSAPARNRGTAAYWFLFVSEMLDTERLIEILADT